MVLIGKQYWDESSAGYKTDFLPYFQFDSNFHQSRYGTVDRRLSQLHVTGPY